MTDSGRTVYGGGGISPDEKYLPPKLNKFQTEILRKSSFFNFSAKFFGGKEAKLPSKEWVPDAPTMTEFHDFLLKERAQFTEAEYAENNDWTRQQLRRELFITAFGVEDARKIALESDPVVLKGIEAMPKAKALLDGSKKMIVQQRMPKKSDR